MPLPIISLAILAAMLLGDIHAAAAQSPYSYPWCSIRGRGGGMSCYYTSWEQCRATMSGIGGLCINSPYHRATPAPEPLRRRAAGHRK